MSNSPTDPRQFGARRWRVWFGRSLLAGIAMAALLIGNHLFWRQHLKRFQELRPGVFYRTAQPTEFGLRYLQSHYGIQTVLCLRRFELIQLGQGWFDIDEPDGTIESRFVREQMGINYVQWPMGDEACWPWLTPWHFDEFFRLVDDPDNHPIVIHCMGGRHRTGTLAALFRLEYDRWTPDAVLAEMHSFKFGPPIPVHEHNLRTYLPRPLPDAEELAALHEATTGLVDGAADADYPQLVRLLRRTRGDSAVEAMLERYVRQEQPFALEWVARLIDTPDDPLAEVVAEVAVRRVVADDASFNERATAAALLADFGTPEHHQRLTEWIKQQQTMPVATAEYEAVAAGLMNRYTPNRVAWLNLLLNDARKRVGEHTSLYRYCDSAVARLGAIVNVQFRPASSSADWETAVESARHWLAAQRRHVEFSQLLPPSGNNPVRPGRALNFEDLSRLPK